MQDPFERLKAGGLDFVDLERVGGESRSGFDVCSGLDCWAGIDGLAVFTGTDGSDGFEAAGGASSVDGTDAAELDEETLASEVSWGKESETLRSFWGDVSRGDTWPCSSDVWDSVGVCFPSSRSAGSSFDWCSGNVLLVGTNSVFGSVFLEVESILASVLSRRGGSTFETAHSERVAVETLVDMYPLETSLMELFFESPTGLCLGSSTSTEAGGGTSLISDGTVGGRDSLTPEEAERGGTFLTSAETDGDRTSSASGERLGARTSSTTEGTDVGRTSSTSEGGGLGGGTSTSGERLDGRTSSITRGTDVGRTSSTSEGGGLGGGTSTSGERLDGRTSSTTEEQMDVEPPQPLQKD